jgi:hypothetical protein
MRRISFASMILVCFIMLFTMSSISFGQYNLPPQTASLSSTGSAFVYKDANWTMTNMPTGDYPFAYTYDHPGYTYGVVIHDQSTNPPAQIVAKWFSSTMPECPRDGQQPIAHLIHGHSYHMEIVYDLGAAPPTAVTLYASAKIFLPPCQPGNGN